MQSFHCFLESEVGVGLPGGIVRAEPQVFVRLMRIDKLVRVELVRGVPDALEVAEGLHQLRPEHLREQRAACLTISVFT